MIIAAITTSISMFFITKFKIKRVVRKNISAEDKLIAILTINGTLLRINKLLIALVLTVIIYSFM